MWRGAVRRLRSLRPPKPHLNSTKPQMRNIYIETFATFFRIGMFTFGGGYAMIPLIEQEVVARHKWVTKEEMVDLIAISQSCPGVFAINLSTFIGYKLRKKRGALCASVGTAMPSFLCILVVAAIFRGIRPAVVALIAVPTFDLARSAKINLSNCWIPIAGALAIWAFGVSPILIILLAAFGGYIYGKYIKPTEQ